ncbi:GH1 family beta-glucosidase [Leptothrix discophora]|uniref:Beta-glucosidase n=1 Tax=Leptothrix discophora TaxID=89 RepID=A0ABT9G310_LEPDI|nr:GH1 family beta-glucosidase [Leptothrix discophora]MDP4300865.1 GH1 family beta-glucosidase [Leptothrix discophora]
MFTTEFASHVPLPTHRFPADFRWGVATSAFQIEGAADVDGKGPSIWDTFCRRPGVIADGSDGTVACEHYHRLDADLDLIASLGVDAYRFSIAWPRVRPTGAGDWNEAGLAFYDRLIDGLNARGIQPHLTLNHWDLPEALQATGGWADRATVQRFVDYALGIAARYGRRVAAITTHNEPWVMAVLGHEAGIFAPGIRDRAIAAQVAHHLLLSHGLAVRAMRAAGCSVPMGIVLNLSPTVPATDSAADRARALLEDGRLLRWYMDPLFHGRYPVDILDDLGEQAPVIEPGDLDAISVPIDFLGINYYTRSVASAGAPWVPGSSGLPLTDMGWEVHAPSLTELLLRLARDYPVPPLTITENGGAFPDACIDGRVADHDRTEYLAGHIAAVGEAMRQGVPVNGYFVWSLMDNFEWASGYAKRFGIVHVDYTTQVRTPKASAHWYRRFLQHQQALRASALGIPTGD